MAGQGVNLKGNDRSRQLAEMVRQADSYFDELLLIEGQLYHFHPTYAATVTTTSYDGQLILPLRDR